MICYIEYIHMNYIYLCSCFIHVFLKQKKYAKIFAMLFVQFCQIK